VIIIDALTGTTLKSFIALSPTINSLGRPPYFTHLIKWSPDGQYLGAVSSDGVDYVSSKYITVWNVSTGEALKNEPVTNPYIDDFEWNPKNLHEAVYSREIGDAIVFDPLSGNIISTLQIGKLGDQEPGEYEMLSLAWSTDGTELAAVAPYSDKNTTLPPYDRDVVVVWNTKSFEMQTKVDKLYVARVRLDLHWSDNGNYLLVGGSNSIQVIDIKAAHLKAKMMTSTSILALTWSSNNYKIIVCNENSQQGISINIINSPYAVCPYDIRLPFDITNDAVSVTLRPSSDLRSCAPEQSAQAHQPHGRSDVP